MSAGLKTARRVSVTEPRGAQAEGGRSVENQIREVRISKCRILWAVILIWVLSLNDVIARG